MKKIITIVVVALVFSQLLMVLAPVRVALSGPLFVNDIHAEGDVAYVLSGGNAIWERLRAAADLYHLNRTKEIILLEDNRVSSYSFIERQSWRATQWQIAYLKWLGVPESNVNIYSDTQQALFGTLKEARIVATQLPDSVSSLVIVTSAPHTRRSLLAFERNLPDIAVSVYAATEIYHSSEFFYPIWVEYVKLLVYWIAA